MKNCKALLDEIFTEGQNHASKHPNRSAHGFHLPRRSTASAGSADPAAAAARSSRSECRAAWPPPRLLPFGARRLSASTADCGRRCAAATRRAAHVANSEEPVNGRARSRGARVRADARWCPREATSLCVCKAAAAAPCATTCGHHHSFNFYLFFKVVCYTSIKRARERVLQSSLAAPGLRVAYRHKRRKRPHQQRRPRVVKVAAALAVVI